MGSCLVSEVPEVDSEVQVIHCFHFPLIRQSVMFKRFSFSFLLKFNCNTAWLLNYFSLSNSDYS
jgi:hypothetical protein